MFGIYLVPISIYKFKRQIKLHLNFNLEFAITCIRIPSEILQSLPLFKLENSIPSTKTGKNLLHKHL